ncbi:MAG: tRNA nucleotidyltransferase, partial [Oscillospiraceae bacterium]|nr:tRNA nucleotidyltransferase [Oscillospiraceae bacterium]
MRVKENVQAVMQALEGAGFEAYAVGGAVRDSLLGKEPFDWDVTTSALPEQVMERFGDAAIPTGLKHGTVTVLQNGERIEVTTYRKDGDYADHRHPVAVEFTPSLREDLQRRDFTVNAIALSWDGIVIDPFEGQADLAAGVLRAVGDAEQRFEEDALRILRGLRFASVLD